MNFEELCVAEFLQEYRNLRRFQFLMLIRELEYDLYVGIYGEEPPE